MDGIFPAEIKAGLTLNHLVPPLTAYPATDWVMTVALRGPTVIDLVAAADGRQHRLTATATETAAYAPGLYAYSVRVTRGEDVVEIQNATVPVLPNLAQSAGGDMRSQNRIALDNIRAVLAERATLDQESYRINNRELYRTPIDDLVKLEAYYANRVRQEEAKARGKSKFGRTIRMRLN